MRDEPQGRFVLRPRGAALTAKRFHLYRDCRQITAYEGGDEDSYYEVVDIDTIFGFDSGEQVIDLLGLEVCGPCNNRAHEVSIEDVVADLLYDYRDIEGQRPLDRSDADELARRVMKEVDSHGFRIRRERRGGKK